MSRPCKISLAEIDFLILCGGLGTRLRSVVSDRPKSLAKIQSAPFLEIQLRYLIHQGARRFTLCAGHLGDEISRFVETFSFPDCRVQVSKEPHALGTGGALANALDRIESPLFFALNGDSFCEVRLQEMLAMHQRMASQLTIATVNVPDTSAYGRVVSDTSHAITAFEEKNSGSKGAGSGMINAGIYLIDRTMFQNTAPKQSAFSIEKDLFPKLVGHKLFAYPLPKGIFLDIGTPENYGRAADVLKKFAGG